MPKRKRRKPDPVKVLGRLDSVYRDAKRDELKQFASSARKSLRTTLNRIATLESRIEALRSELAEARSVSRKQALAVDDYLRETFGVSVIEDD